LTRFVDLQQCRGQILLRCVVAGREIQAFQQAAHLDGVFGEEAIQSLFGGLTLETVRRGGLQNSEIRRESSSNCVFEKQASAEGVDGGDPGSLQRLAQVWTACEPLY
jgi:hypothetical protein